MSHSRSHRGAFLVRWLPTLAVVGLLSLLPTGSATWAQPDSEKAVALLASALECPPPIKTRTTRDGTSVSRSITTRSFVGHDRILAIDEATVERTHYPSTNKIEIRELRVSLLAPFREFSEVRAAEDRSVLFRCSSYMPGCIIRTSRSNGDTGTTDTIFPSIKLEFCDQDAASDAVFAVDILRQLESLATRPPSTPR